MSEATAGPVLYFAPESTLLNKIRSFSDREIVTTDLNSTDVDHPGEDIQGLTFSEGSFAVILCNHVLEHVPDDRNALGQCARVLKRGGTAIFTIPGDFPLATTREFRRPDSNGHHRHYGMQIVDIMKSYFDEVIAAEMASLLEPRYMVRKNDYIFICKKLD